MAGHDTVVWVVGWLAYQTLGLIVVALVLPPQRPGSGWYASFGRGRTITLLAFVWPAVLVLYLVKWRPERLHEQESDRAIRDAIAEHRERDSP